jgi:hypothetical protein
MRGIKVEVWKLYFFASNRSPTHGLEVGHRWRRKPAAIANVIIFPMKAFGFQEKGVLDDL